MKFLEFASSLNQKVTEPLRARGFKKLTNRSFVRFKCGHEINVIALQKHSVKPSVCLNLGVHYDFLPKAGSVALAHDGWFELPDCEIQVRLTPDPSTKDYWWPATAESIDEMAGLIDERVEDFFGRYDINGDIFSISPDELREGMPEIVAMLTKVRACLVLARIRELSGDVETAANFARLGIEVAGMAVGPKVALKEILQRVGHG